MFGWNFVYLSLNFQFTIRFWASNFLAIALNAYD